MSPPNDLEPVARSVCAEIGAEIEQHLGEGAYKQVFLVSAGGIKAALKVTSLAPHRVERLRREIEALRSCSHPNIARLIECRIYAHNGENFLVAAEEYLRGGTLESACANGVLPSRMVASLGVAMSSAIKHMEERRLVHRDIKPANIIYRAADEPVLTDFGVVRFLEQPTLTADYQSMGPCTPRYASPEQLCNDKELIDWRTDQFDLALVLAECLLGRHAFAETAGDFNTARAIQSVASRAPLPVVSERELCVLGFECLVKALQVWPIHRYARPNQFYEALTRVESTQ